MTPRISLEQWRALIAVVEAGGYAQGAERLHKTQSTLTYAVQKLQESLGVKVFERQGRKAVLTPTGQVLYRRAKALVDEAATLELAAGRLGQGWEPELTLAVEIVFPTWLLLDCFAAFAQERPEVRIQLHETVLGGTEEALIQRRVDLAITSFLPQGFIGDVLMPMRFVCAAHPDHPLHALGRPLTLQDLRKHRQLVIRDSGQQARRDTGVWLGAEQRWTVSHKATSIAAATMGLGFAWYPEETIARELQDGRLKPLPLREGGVREIPLYLIFADRDYAGPGALRLAELIRERVAGLCRAELATRAEPAAAASAVQSAPMNRRAPRRTKEKRKPVE